MKFRNIVFYLTFLTINLFGQVKPNLTNDSGIGKDSIIFKRIFEIKFGLGQIMFINQHEFFDKIDAFQIGGLHLKSELNFWISKFGAISAEIGQFEIKNNFVSKNFGSDINISEQNTNNIYINFGPKIGASSKHIEFETKIAFGLLTFKRERVLDNAFTAISFEQNFNIRKTNTLTLKGKGNMLFFWNIQSTLKVFITKKISLYTDIGLFIHDFRYEVSYTENVINNNSKEVYYNNTYYSESLQLKNINLFTNFGLSFKLY